MIADDFTAQKPVQVVLQCRQLPGEFFQLRKMDGTDFTVLQSKCIAGVLFGANGVQAEHLAGQLEAGDLLAAIERQHAGLE